MGICDICGQEPQAMQIGNMETGQQLFVCVGCYCRWSLDLIKQVLPAEEIAAQLGPLFVRPEREDLHQEAAAERAKRPRKSKAKTEASEGKTGGPAEVAPAAENE